MNNYNNKNCNDRFKNNLTFVTKESKNPWKNIIYTCIPCN